MISLMGRKRTSNHNLPPRMHKKGDMYYYVTSTAPRKWIKLDENLGKARVKWAQIENGGVLSGSAFPVVLQEWLCGEQYLKLAPLTKKTYQTLIYVLPTVFDGPMEAIKPVHVAQFMDAYPSKSQANIGRVILGNVFDYAIRRGLVDCINPAKAIKKHVIAGRTRHLTDAEFNAIRDKANDSVKVAMDIAYLTGARISDVLKIRFTDLQEDGLFIEQHKTKKRQLFTWTESLSEVISLARKIPRPVKNITHLLCTRVGKAYSYAAFYQVWSIAVANAGISDVHFHDIRGNAATEAKKQGQDYQAILGHASKSMSEKYIKAREIETVQTVKRSTK